MASITRQLLSAANKPRPTTKKDDPIKLDVGKIILSNSDLTFSLEINPVVQISAFKEGGQILPSYRPSRSSIVYILSFYTEDLELAQDLQNNLNNFEVLDQLMAENLDKLEIINTPYEDKELKFTGNNFVAKKQEKFSPKRYKSRSNPKNLFLYSMVIRESVKTGKRKLLSQPYFQRVVENNRVLLQNNIVDLRNSKFDNYLDFDIVNQTDSRQKAYFSDLFSGTRSSGILGATFFWNKIEFLKEMSLYGNILKNGSIPSARQKMIEDSRITELKIIRKRVKKNIDGFSLFNKNQKNEVIIYSSEDGDGDFITASSKNRHTGNLKSRISTIRGIKNAGEYISFAFEDYAPLRLGVGIYQYEVQVKLRDGMLKFLMDSLEDLRKYAKDFETYQNTYLTAASSKDIIDQNINKMLNICFSMKEYSQEKMQRIRNEFFILSSSVTGFQKIANFNMDLMTKISYALGKQGVSNSTSKTNSFKNIADSFSLQDTQTFQNIIDFSEMKKTSNSYLEMDDGLSIGLSSYSENSIKSRFLSEFRKYINLEDEVENINFSDLSNKMYKNSTKLDSNQDIRSGLFNFEENFYTYLTPQKIDSSGKSLKNNQFNYKNYIPQTQDSIEKQVRDIANLGLTIVTKQEEVKQNDTEVCSEEIFGDDDKLSDQKTYQNNSSINSLQNKINYSKDIKKSSTLLNGVSAHYNNFNLVKENYDLDSPNNFLYKKTEERRELYTDVIKDLPNQIRALLGSKSDFVKNKWNLMSNDFFANTESSNMMKENFSNLIRVEILSGFEKDSSGMTNSKNPIFRKLTKQDFDNLLSGEQILCRTYVVDDISLGLGQKNKTQENLDNYYNKFFIISKEVGE